MKIQTAFFAAIICILFCFPCASFEIKSVPPMSGTSFLRWELNRGPVIISLNSRGTEDLPLKDTEAGVRAALDTWKGVSGQNLNIYYEGISSERAKDGDGRNTIQWVEKHWQYAESTLAVTKYTYVLEDPPVFHDADILLNGEHYHWGTNLTSNHPVLDLRQVLVHEAGHMLGLGHTSYSAAQMYPFLQGDVRYSLSRDDREGLRFLYGDSVSVFQLVTPIKRALYERQMADRGLPLPVFRWGPGPVTDYFVEFSGTETFKEKISIHTGLNSYYRMQPVDEQKILKITNANNTVYWRVRSGPTITAPSSIRFKAQ